MAARAGLPLQDQEFVQFHPTGGLTYAALALASLSAASAVVLGALQFRAQPAMAHIANDGARLTASYTHAYVLSRVFWMVCNS